MDGEMDLQILLTLENNQQATVRQWFGQKVGEAQTIFKVTEEDKNDLIDSLYEVMLEKGIAPTPMQELIINSVKAFVIDMGVKAMMFNNQIKGVLEQLRQLKREENEQNVANLNEEDTGEVVESPAVAETQVEQTQ
jgi:NACalpha-BTF3-like transcription factor